MAIQFGTVDGLVNITKGSILCFVKGIDEFVSQGGPAFAKNNEVSYGTAFQRFVEPVYADKSNQFTLTSINTPVLTRSGAEQSPARGTFCKKMGLLKVDEPNDLFELTPLGRAILNNDITIQEYAFILLSKMGIYKDDNYVDNLLRIISLYFESNAIISQSSLGDYTRRFYNDPDIVKTRFDIIINALALTGLVSKVTNDIYVLSGTGQAELFLDYYNHSSLLCKAEIDTSKEYGEYIGNLDYGGVFDVLSKKNIDIYTRYFPNLRKYMKSESNYGSIQQIYYGAPGTGKSHRIKEIIQEKGIDEKEQVIRTTFHPDSDYSTFVGCYKPIMKSVPQTYVVEGKEKPVIDIATGKQSEKEEIVYDYTPQAFIQAYTKAWANPQKPVILIIEEINRGNCAQIFGDIFQLLDRGDDGVSDYEIKPDKALEDYLKGYFVALKDVEIPERIKSGTIMKLPSNFYIWATMNTSDQSLFPIDSAFKRRWDWVYMPIENEGKNWKIVVNQHEYDWWDFLVAINKEVFDLTHSEDKQLGYFFAKAKDTKIDVEMLVNKVYFYLWTDVFKDYDYESQKAFRKPNSNEPIAFKDFFEKGKVNEVMAEQVLINLELNKPKENAE